MAEGEHSPEGETMLRISGLVLMGAGAASAVALLIQPFDPRITHPSSSWLLFPLCYLGGALLFGLGSGQQALKTATAASGRVLLLLSLIAVVELVLADYGVLKPYGSMLSLWYVAGLGLLAGTPGVLAHRPVGLRA